MSCVAPVAQMVERVLGKDEVTGSIPVGGLSWRGVREAVLAVNHGKFPRPVAPIGRAAVSKTAGCRFKSCQACNR